jgi:hypothetical protein
MNFNVKSRTYTVVLVVATIVRPPRAIGGAKGRCGEYTIFSKSPRGLDGIIILRCVRVIVESNVASTIRYLHLRFIAKVRLEGANPKNTLQVVSLECLIEFKEEWLWHDGLMEVLGGRNEFELVGVIDITIESPGYWENARVQGLRSLIGPRYRCAASIDKTFVVFEAEVAMEELNAEKSLNIVFGEDISEGCLHDCRSIALFEFGVGIMERGECIEHRGRVRLKNWSSH